MDSTASDVRRMGPPIEHERVVRAQRQCVKSLIPKAGAVGSSAETPFPTLLRVNRWLRWVPGMRQGRGGGRCGTGTAAGHRQRGEPESLHAPHWRTGCRSGLGMAWDRGGWHGHALGRPLRVWQADVPSDRRASRKWPVLASGQQDSDWEFRPNWCRWQSAGNGARYGVGVPVPSNKESIASPAKDNEDAGSSSADSVQIKLPSNSYIGGGGGGGGRKPPPPPPPCWSVVRPP